MPKTFFLDTSFLVAQYNLDDFFHQKTTLILKKITTGKLYSDELAIAESVYVLFRKYSLKPSGFLNWLNRDTITVVNIESRDWLNAYQQYGKVKSKQGYNVFDCVHYAVMKRLGINTIATFDEDFKDLSVKIIS